MKLVPTIGNLIGNGIAPYIRVIINSLIGEWEYRLSYVILLFSSFITVFMEWAVIGQLYGDAPSKHGLAVGGLDYRHALPFVVLGLLVRNGSALWSMVDQFSEEVRDGRFRRFLLQPISIQSYFYASAIGPKLTTWTLSLVAIVIVKQFSTFDTFLPVHTLPSFLLSLTVAYVLTWQIYFFIFILCFWLEDTHSLNIAFNLASLFTGTIIPFFWLPQSLQNILRWTPLPVIGDFPVRTGLGLLPPSDFFGYLSHGLAWYFGLFILNQILLRFAIRRYEAFGG